MHQATVEILTLAITMITLKDLLMAIRFKTKWQNLLAERLTSLQLRSMRIATK